MSDEILQFDRADPARKAQIQRELENTARLLHRGHEARERRLKYDAAFARAVEAVKEMPKEVRVLYADLCAEPLPANLSYDVHKEIKNGTFSAVVLYRCRQVYEATNPRYHMERVARDRMIARIDKAIRLRERG